ncbi:hypothetical protein D0865_12543 [Hortaea werneckii]|uniref:DUF3074 domain-containing protein n=1 Tax=Hortaea werneckii TaxID=91943 RepID=A0A3M7BL48_HORWE|nr:hypothetical protein D0865_12543 [Hortaea werneckii]
MAAELHDALRTLLPTNWSDVPQDNLDQYMKDAYSAGELIINSVPPPPNGEPFHSSEPHFKQPNTAGSVNDMYPSRVRSFPPHKDHEDLQKHWGKPMKFDKSKNPLDVSVYKMAGKDRHGAWFARSSVLEGMGFDKFKRAMQREFPHSLTVKGGPGAGAVRGLAADRRVERLTGEAGKLEVFELSAQFPGPVTPREFIPLIMTTESALSDKSAAEMEGGKTHLPRHYMIVSRPVDHPDAPERSGFVRGRYESVELIREIPLHQAKAKSTPNLPSQTEGEHHEARSRGHTVGAAESKDDGAKEDRQHLHPKDAAGGEESSPDRELNPVEWIMITRSDPGGGIPRFLVERGTPEAMLGDVTKFLTWATSFEGEVPDPEEDLDQQQQASQENAQVSDAQGQPTTTLPEGVAKSSPEIKPMQKSMTEPPTDQNGFLSRVEAGLDAYAPAAVASGYRNYMHPDQKDGNDDSESSSDDSSSVNSFMSAEEMRRVSTTQQANPDQPNASTEALSLASGDSSAELAMGGKSGEKKNQHEKEILKIARERERLDRRLAKKRADEEEKLKKSQEKDQTEQDKAKDKLERDMKKAEERHRKEIEKLERKKEKEAKKAEEKKRKKDDASKLSMVSRERDEFRNQLDSYKRENQLLVERMEELQRENTLLAQRVGKLGGNEALKGVQDEMGTGKKRTKSMDSKRSLDSGEKTESKEAAAS